MNSHKEHTEQQAAQEYWKGEPPKQCTGTCKIVDLFMIAGCESCGWCEDMPKDTTDIYNHNQ